MNRKLINILGLLVVLVVNYLANALPLNGKNTGELSDQYVNLFVPIGLTFAIWGVIYLLLLVVVGAGAIRKENALRDADWWFAWSCLLNAGWIFAWHYEWLMVSVVIMLLLLHSLVTINQRLMGSGDSLTRLTFGIYLGWICVATVANVTALLVANRWSGFGLSDSFWTVSMIGVATVVVSVTIWVLKNPFLGLSTGWAFLGIALKRHLDYPVIAWVAALCLAFVLAFAALSRLKWRKPIKGALGNSNQ